jgi:7-keto-8-aminopelargonate synthetase-like enzyme
MICMGTLSKAYGAIGGFIATEGYLAEILRYACTAYGFTSTLPPDQAAAVSEAIDMAADEPQRRRRLWDNQKYFVRGMDKLGYNLVSRASCILPVLIGDDAICEQYSQTLLEHGFHVDSILFPAVGKDQSRLRFIMNANHTREQIDSLLAVMKDLKSSPMAMKS